MPSWSHLFWFTMSGHGGHRSGSGRKRIYTSKKQSNIVWQRGHQRISTFNHFIILPSLQMIHFGRNTVQENEIYSDSNVFRCTLESHFKPAACFNWVELAKMFVQFGGSWLLIRRLELHLQFLNDQARSWHMQCHEYIYLHRASRLNFWPSERRLISKIFIAYRQFSFILSFLISILTAMFIPAVCKEMRV